MSGQAQVELAANCNAAELTSVELAEQISLDQSVFSGAARVRNILLSTR
jgi:hypothetical protein